VAQVQGTNTIFFFQSGRHILRWDKPLVSLSVYMLPIQVIRADFDHYLAQINDTEICIADSRTHSFDIAL